MYIHIVSYNKLNVFIVIAVVLDTYEILRSNKLHSILISYKKKHDNNLLDSGISLTTNSTRHIHINHSQLNIYPS